MSGSSSPNVGPSQKLPPRSSLSGSGNKKSPGRPRSSLETLLHMGFTRQRSLKALASTGANSRHGGAQIAADWLLAHINDPALDSSSPRHFHLHLVPNADTDLSRQLQTFWDASATQIGWNGAPNCSPHITLMAGLAVPDDKVDRFVGLVQKTALEFQADFHQMVASHNLSLERYVSPNFLGFFVGKPEEILLRSFVAALTERVKRLLGLSINDAHGQGDAKASFHVTLAYQFPQKHYAGLQDLAATVEPGANTDWELRLYSVDGRMATKADVSVFKVVHAHKPSEPDELELISGDFVYVGEQQPTIGLEEEGGGASWVSGTSWLTGNSGYLPKNFVIQTPEINAWTVHLAMPLGSGKDSSIETASSSTSSLDRLKDLNTPNALKEVDGHSLLPSDLEVESLCTPSTSGGLPGEEIGMVKKPRQPRRIFVVRHGERVDFTFGTWIPFSFNKAGMYERKDLNMPKNVPDRCMGPEGFLRDCPLTVIGSVQAALTGEAMKESGVSIAHVYCSPSLRCVQTCTSILKGLDATHLKLHIEPGLFEWLAWYQDAMPNWMTAEEFKIAGFNVELSYKPYISADELQDSLAQGSTEGCEAYYTRNFFVTQCVLAATEDAGGDVLFVGHAATLDACSRQLCGSDPRPMPDMMSVVRKVAYCGVALLQEEEANKPGGKRVWKLREPPFPPLTHCSTPRFDIKALMDP